MQPLDLYEKASEWVATLMPGAADKLDAPTPCDEWDVRTLVSHMIDTQRYFAATARGRDASLPNPQPPDLVGADPAKAWDAARADTLDAFRQPESEEKAGFAIGVAFSDSLIHGWDLATATGQDATMPAGLAEAAYQTVHGKFADEQRQGIFKSEVAPPTNASAQERLLAYTGRVA